MGSSRLALVAAAVVSTAVPVAVWASAAGEDAPKGGTPVVQPSDDGNTYRDDADGFSVSYPDSWNRATEALMPSLEDPREILTLGTAPLVPGGDRCAQVPESSMEAMGRGDVILSLMESSGTLTGRYTIDRPARFDPSHGYESDAGDCLVPRREGFSSRMIPFRDQGRSFYALVVTGPDASEETRTEAMGILDSLVIDER